MSIEEIRRIAIECKKQVERRIYYSYETDVCTECFSQGLEDALSEFEYLLDEIESAYQAAKQEEIFSGRVLPQPGQIALPID